jgi:hypothetical protein
MERCTAALKGVPKYLNDPRFVRVWIEYVSEAHCIWLMLGLLIAYLLYVYLCVLQQADRTRDPLVVFKFMYANKIGSKLSMFWIAWAFVAETNGCFHVAEKALTDGINW